MEYIFMKHFFIQIYEQHIPVMIQTRYKLYNLQACFRYRLTSIFNRFSESTNNSQSSHKATHPCFAPSNLAPKRKIYYKSPREFWWRIYDIDQMITHKCKTTIYLLKPPPMFWISKITNLWTFLNQYLWINKKAVWADIVQGCCCVAEHRFSFRSTIGTVFASVKGQSTQCACGKCAFF